MGRENKKEAVAALHREKIMRAAEKLFSEKGFERTTVDDISKLSDYSRRTVYAYYQSKEDILHHIIEKGLISLKNEIEAAVNADGGFVSQYKAICAAMTEYQREYPQSFENVKSGQTADIDFGGISDTVKHIFALGEEINGLLASFIERGKASGEVRKDVEPMMTVYILWSNISSLITLAKTKGKYICSSFSVSEDEFLEYGFKQIINSVLEVRI